MPFAPWFAAAGVFDELTWEAAVQAHDTLKHLSVRIREKELEVKETQQLAIKHEQQMNSASSKKEYDAFKLEIANEKKKALELEDEILRTMLEIDERKARLPDEDKAVEQAKREFAEYEKSHASRQASLAEQLQQAQQSLKEVEASLPEDIRAQYDRTVQSHGHEGFAAVQNNACTECYTEITRSIELRLLNDDFAVCPRCGRILYLPEEAMRQHEE